MGWWLFLGGVRQDGISRGHIFCLEYQHPDTDVKTAQTAEAIRRKGENGRPPVCVMLFTATLAPWRDEDKKGGVQKKVGWGQRMRLQRGKAFASVRGWGMLCYEMDIPACWSCWPVWLLKRQWGIRVQPGCLLPGPGWSQDTRKEPATNSTACKQTKYRGKDEVWCRGCCCLHALSPSLTLSLLINPKHFPLVSARKSNITPSNLWCPELTCFEKIMCCFICGVLKYTFILSSAPHACKIPSKWLLR